MDIASVYRTNASDVSTRLRQLWETTGDRNLWRLSCGAAPDGMVPPSTPPEQRDATSSCLMGCFQATGSEPAFELLATLNRTRLLSVIRTHLRTSSSRLDPEDVCQEVLLKIYRYPTRFVCDRSDAFRHWSNGIARNTVCTLVQREARHSRDPELGAFLEEVLPDRASRRPLQRAVAAEAAELVDLAYLIYLNLYLVQYRQLAPRERRALQLVELRGDSYAAAGAKLGVGLNNFKMLLFRARQKIVRGIHRTVAVL